MTTTQQTLLVEKVAEMAQNYGHAQLNALGNEIVSVFEANEELEAVELGETFKNAVLGSGRLILAEHQVPELTAFWVAVAEELKA